MEFDPVPYFPCKPSPEPFPECARDRAQYRLQQLSFELSQTMSEIVERRLEGQVKISAAR